MSKLLSIPVRAHIKDFLLKSYGLEPVRIHLSSDIGKLLRLVVHQEPFRQISPRLVTSSEKETVVSLLPPD